jgi:hypothetical protein
MSRTFTLTGNTSVLSRNYFPPIELHSTEYCLGLIAFHTFNTIPNIEEGCNKFYFGSSSITIPTGSYEITDIEKYLRRHLISSADTKNDADLDTLFSLKPNNNTLQCELFSIYDVNFQPADSIGKLLGFSGKKILQAKKLHVSDQPVEIIKVSSVRIECNIITGSYYDDKSGHTLREFFPSVDPGFAINIEPNNISYLPVNTKTIDNITIRLLDQNGELVNFRNEKIIVRLELIERSKI